MTCWHPLPAEVYDLVEHSPATVLLEGRRSHPVQPGARPWTQLFIAPERVLSACTAGEISNLFAQIELAVSAGKYAAGFFTYECGSCFEPKGASRPPREGLPLAWFGIYERSYPFDHVTGAFVAGEPPELKRFRDARSTAAAAHDMLKSHGLNAAETAQENLAALARGETLTADFALSESDYAQRIAAIHEYIRAGDVYQLNFTAPFRVEAPGSVAAHYELLRARQPVDYGALLHWQSGGYILSFSPELFFRVEGDGKTRNILTRPMKGTAPRGRTTAEDQRIADWLQKDAKNRSENVMIVDLLRNDLGRIAEFGSVRVENLFSIERYPTLWQMTSTVTAELRPEIGFHDIFRALFPCGSITGAPKVRAMQLISQIEETPRGVYTGAIGFFSPQKSVFNVAIRTLELTGGHGIFGAGSGIVIDSDPAEEFRECLLKAQFLAGPPHRTSDLFAVSQPDKLFLIETMLWNGSYPLLNLHLDRLEDSAGYFGFACDRAEIRAALEEHAVRFADAAPRKVRLLLIDENGNLQIGDELLAPATAGNRIGRVRVSPHRTDPANPALYHKTTQRPLYALEYSQASADGYDDVLFLNLRGEVTEGAISNVFIEKDGRWFTPPIECGLLAGVYRRHLLETRSEIEERALLLDDLRTAGSIYLTNAVRGLRPVNIDW
jgi:para-aminobenzoate synthetase/4-amino-4-deoxychorismate lyase